MVGECWPIFQLISIPRISHILCIWNLIKIIPNINHWTLPVMELWQELYFIPLVVPPTLLYSTLNEFIKLSIHRVVEEKTLEYWNTSPRNYYWYDISKLGKASIRIKKNNLILSSATNICDKRKELLEEVEQEFLKVVAWLGYGPPPLNWLRHQYSSHHFQIII